MLRRIEKKISKGEEGAGGVDPGRSWHSGCRRLACLCPSETRAHKRKEQKEKEEEDGEEDERKRKGEDKEEEETGRISTQHFAKKTAMNMVQSLPIGQYLWSSRALRHGMK